MTVSLTESLERAWNHMVRVLFRPFDLSKWLVLGFSAWLASLTSCGSGGGGGGGGDDDSSIEVDAVNRAATDVWAYLVDNPWIAALILLGFVFLVALLALLTWISSRGKFIFLDNVVNNRAEIVEPWRRLGPLGDSLFLFRLAFGLLQLPLVLGMVTVAFWLAFSVFDSGEFSAAPVFILLVAGGVLFILVWALVAGLISFFLDAFIVPIMYRFDLDVLIAWEYFLPLLWRHTGSFLLCALAVLLIAILVGVGITTLGCMTCCLGFILLAIPYLGTVILLPIHVAYRAFTLELLGQIDSNLALMQRDDEPHMTCRGSRAREMP